MADAIIQIVKNVKYKFNKFYYLEVDAIGTNTYA